MFFRKLLQTLLNYFPLPQNKHLDCLYLAHATESCQRELSFLPWACFGQRRDLTLPNKPSAFGHPNKATFLNDITLQLPYNHQQNARASVSDTLGLSATKASSRQEMALHWFLQRSRAGGCTARRSSFQANPLYSLFQFSINFFKHRFLHLL